jgi:ABC-type transport system involved in Fe-S cluster assembly fused permease/ATPase subunit
MDHKERESKANLAPVRESIPRVFNNMQGLSGAGTKGGKKLRISIARRVSTEVTRESLGLLRVAWE